MKRFLAVVLTVTIMTVLVHSLIVTASDSNIAPDSSFSNAAKELPLARGGFETCGPKGISVLKKISGKPSKSLMKKKVDKYFSKHKKYKFLWAHNEFDLDDTKYTYVYTLRSTSPDYHEANVLVGMVRVNWKTGKCSIKYEDLLGILVGKDSFNLWSAKGKLSSPSAKYKVFIAKNGIENYKIIDVDGNGIKELCCYNNYLNEVYTYNKKKGKMIRLVSEDSGKSHLDPEVNVSKHQVMTIIGSTGGFGYVFYKINGEKAKQISSFSSYSEKIWGDTGELRGYKTIYYIDDKEVTESVYNAKYKKMSKGFK